MARRDVHTNQNSLFQVQLEEQLLIAIVTRFFSSFPKLPEENHDVSLDITSKKDKNKE